MSKLKTHKSPKSPMEENTIVPDLAKMHRAKNKKVRGETALAS